MLENISVFDFELSAEDMETLIVLHKKPIIFLMLIALLAGCGGNSTIELVSSSGAESVVETVEKGQVATEVALTEAITATIAIDAPEDEPTTGYKTDTRVWDVIDDPAFEGYGRLIFPVDKVIDRNMTLGEVGRILTWYTYVNPDRTVEIVAYMKAKAEAGEQIFYDIYTHEEKAADPAKENTGLFFFRGNPGERFAIVNAGGGFAYVGAMHDSFPHALELSKKGYNAFALIYRPGAETASEDLARAIAFVHEHANELAVDTADYSLWGGSAGARMAAWLGSYGTAAYGEAEYPRPAAVIMQYTGLTEVNGNEPPTYASVGANDGIASNRVMENRIEQIKANGTDAEIEIFADLPHGFGLGEGTIAEGWIDRAVTFWENQMDRATVQPVPQELAVIPQEYFQPAAQQGTLVDLYYDTYESFSYHEQSEPLQKHAVVYLPYGYSEDQEYDVFYLMHGGWSDETTTLGTPQSPAAFKNVIDHAIAVGELRPLIIVCPTYNNTNENGRDSDNFSLAMRLTENYPNELINDLIPAVEGTYSTYAASIRQDDLIASRDHRGFGGFSMGSVTTWRTFQYGLDYFRYFLPMSCGTSLNEEEIFAAAAGHAPDDYFVFVMTGTDDFAYSYDQDRTDLMRASRYFSDVDVSDTGNFAFRVKEGYSHDGTAAMEYTYNGLVWLMSPLPGKG